MRNRPLGFSLVLILLSSPYVMAQDGPQFQPPRPPPLDNSQTDFEEIDDPDDSVIPPEAPPPPPPSSQGGGAPPTGGDPRANMPSVGGGNFSAGQPKFRFQIVEGEFWEKGKKRSRGKKIRVN